MAPESKHRLQLQLITKLAIVLVCLLVHNVHRGEGTRSRSCSSDDDPNRWSPPTRTERHDERIDHYQQVHPCQLYDHCPWCKLTKERAPICKKGWFSWGCYGKCRNVLKPVCGSIGFNFQNACHVAHIMCLEAREIRIVREGHCRPEECSDLNNPICGSDSQTYT